MSTIVFESDVIIFEQTEHENCYELEVKNKQGGFVHTTYYYKKIDNPLVSSYISWANLNCCNGWHFDKSYLLTAVQDGKKLCAGICFDTQVDVDKYVETISPDFCYFQHEPHYNGSYGFFNFDICRVGSISDYINMDEVARAYKELDIKYDTALVDTPAKTPMIDLINGNAKFDYANCCDSEDLIIAGLLLGYPLESTAFLIIENDEMAERQ